MYIGRLVVIMAIKYNTVFNPIVQNILKHKNINEKRKDYYKTLGTI